MRVARLFLVLFLFAVDARSYATRILPAQSYTTKDGLPSNQINVIAQDSRGYLWIGTNNGLSVYDGETFVTYSTADGLTNNWITSIIESKRQPGVMWVGTIAGGVCKIESGSITPMKSGDAEGSPAVTALVEGSNGVLWSVTTAGVYSIGDDGAPALFLPGVSSPYTDMIVETPDGSLWLGRGSTISVYTPAGIHVTTVQLSTRGGAAITGVTVTRDGNAWVATSDGLLHRFRDTVLVSRHVLPDGIAYSLVGDRQANLWLRTPKDILRASITTDDGVKVDRYPVDDLIPTPTWAGPLFIDREDNLWVGTWSKGILKVSEKNSFKITMNIIGAGAADHHGHIWILTDLGLTEAYVCRNGEWRLHVHPVTEKDRYEEANLLTVHGGKATDPFGRIWLMSRDGAALNGYRVEHRPGLSSRLHRVVSLVRGSHFRTAPFSFHVDTHNRAWIGSFVVEVVDLVSLRHVHTYTMADGLPGESIRVITGDSEGNIWVGDFEQGLSFLHKGNDLHMRFRRLATEDGLPDNRIRAIHQDRDGGVWFGTRHGGLVRYSEGELRTVSMVDGLRSNSIWGIFDDDVGRLWLFTDSGVECVDRQTLTPLVHKRVTGERMLSAGIISDRYLYMMSPTGLTLYDYKEVSLEDVPPFIHITSVQVNGETQPETRTLNLSHSQNTVAVQFAGISFKDEKAVRYRYRLVGLDTIWSQPVERRPITYAALPSGSYTFEVNAMNADGVESAHPARLEFTIVPPYWQRWWFIGLVACAIAVALFGLHRFRVGRLLEMERLRTRIASDLHDDVGTNLSSIMLASQLMDRKFPLSDDERQHLARIRTTAVHTQEMLKDIVWLLNPKNDSLDDFILRLRHIAELILQDTDYVFHDSGSDKVRLVDLEFKRHVVLIFKEILTNTARHSGATSVDISIGFSNDSFLMVVRDNGNGFDITSPHPGNGLANLRMRARAMGGVLEIVSNPGAGGTTVSLSVCITHMRNSTRKFFSVSSSCLS